MRLIKYSAFFGVFLFTFFSCRNSPSTHVMGTYEGNYVRDSITVGNAIANVFEVNALTVNIGLELEQDPDFTLMEVSVNGDEDIYNFTYTGTEGTMEGSVNGTHMLITILQPDDTLTFSGDRKD